MITKPMLGRPATEQDVARLIEDDAWALDVKADGDRKLIVVEDHVVTTYNRDGKRTDLPRTIRNAMGALSGNWIFDGELIANRALALFDLVTAGDMVSPSTPWAERRDMLDRAHAAWAPGPLIRVVPWARTTDEKIDLVQRVVAGRGEGVMGKKVDAPYVPTIGDRRSWTWLKVKRQHEIDCVVDWIGEDKLNAGLVLYRGRKRVPVGEVTRLAGDGARMKKNDVVAVKCLYVSDDNKLVQPTKPRIRRDKRRTDCDVAQLDAARTNKNLILEMT